MLQKFHWFRTGTLAITLAAAFSALPASAEGFPDAREVARAQILGVWRGEAVTSAAVLKGDALAAADRARQGILGHSLPATPVPFRGLAQAPLEQQELARRQILGISTADHPASGVLAAAR